MSHEPDPRSSQAINGGLKKRRTELKDSSQFSSLRRVPSHNGRSVEPLGLYSTTLSAPIQPLTTTPTYARKKGIPSGYRPNDTTRGWTLAPVRRPDPPTGMLSLGSRAGYTDSQVGGKSPESKPSLQSQVPRKEANRASPQRLSSSETKARPHESANSTEATGTLGSPQSISTRDFYSKTTGTNEFLRLDINDIRAAGYRIKSEDGKRLCIVIPWTENTGPRFDAELRITANHSTLFCTRMDSLQEVNFLGDGIPRIICSALNTHSIALAAYSQTDKSPGTKSLTFHLSRQTDHAKLVSLQTALRQRRSDSGPDDLRTPRTLTEAGANTPMKLRGIRGSSEPDDLGSASHPRSSPSQLIPSPTRRLSRRSQGIRPQYAESFSDGEFDGMADPLPNPEVPVPFSGTFHYTFNDRKSIDITEADFNRLNEKEFVNDTTINFFLKLAHERMADRNPELAEATYIFNTFFYERLSSNDKANGTGGFDNVKKWTAKVDIFKKKYVIVPINANLHWYVVVLCNLPSLLLPPEPTSPVVVKTISLRTGQKETPIQPPRPAATPDGPFMLVLDSLQNVSHHAVFRLLRDYLVAESKDKLGITINRSAIRASTGLVPHQDNFCDCGIYLIHYVERFLTDPERFIGLMVFNTKTAREELLQLWRSEHIKSKRQSLQQIITTLVGQAQPSSRVGTPSPGTPSPSESLADNTVKLRIEEASDGKAGNESSEDDEDDIVLISTNQTDKEAIPPKEPVAKGERASERSSNRPVFN